MKYMISLYKATGPNALSGAAFDVVSKLLVKVVPCNTPTRLKMAANGLWRRFIK